MSSVGPTSGSAVSSIMIAVRVPPGGLVNTQLQATLQRVAMQLYTKAHLEAPPSATDFGGGIYDILV